MNKVKHSNTKSGTSRLLILGALLSVSVGLYLALATINGRIISIIFALFLFLGLFISKLKKDDTVFLLLNSVYGFVLLLYFLFTVSSTDEILTSGGCMDICVGEAFIFHFIKVYATFPIFLSGYLLLKFLLERDFIKPFWYRTLSIILLLTAVLTFFYFLATF